MDLTQFKNKDQLCILDKFFVRGARCVLGENLCSELGIAKGTEGKMRGLVWDKSEKKAPNISQLPKGVVSNVLQPAYILVDVKGKIIPVEYRNETLKL